MRADRAEGARLVIIEVDYHLAPAISQALQAAYLAQGLSASQLQLLQQSGRRVEWV